MNDPNMTKEEYIKLEEEKARRRGRVFNWQTATYGKIRDALQCKSQVSTPVNDEIDFRISFDESDDEDYTIICDKNSFSYKMISINDLKMDSENDNEKVVPSIPSPEPAISCFGDLDFFKYFENEFPAIVYNDAQMSKSDLLTEPTLNPQHIDKFDLNDETSVSEFNDLFHFNIICPDDLKLKKDNDNNEIDITQSSEGNEIIHGSCVLSETNMALQPREQRHPFLRYEGLQYTDSDIVDFESRLTRIHRREVHRVQVFDFGGLPDLVAEGLSTRIPSYLQQFRDMILGCAIVDCFLYARRLRSRPEKDVWIVCCWEEENGSFVGRQFVARLAEYFGLLTAKILGGLTVIATKLPIIDMGELVSWYPAIAEDAPAIEEGDQAIPAP
ncbi:hypothetical protein Tco_0926013 [Tanacetum coccineum]|uniref:Uncharacterized protein n=1 Tax=Tanacetum coccineum TaxID=301880 RepID=A0ABQ5DET5_9ASTR